MTDEFRGKAVRTLRLPTTDYNGASIQITPAQQGDSNSRIFRIQLFDERGNVDLSPYSLALLSATRIDNEIFVAEGEIKDGFAYFTLAASMLAEVGRVACDITLTRIEKDGDNAILTSQTFYIYVARSQLIDNDLVGSENYNILVTLIHDVREVERMILLLEAGIQDAESSRILAENTRNDSEQTRQFKENNRHANETVRQEVFDDMLSNATEAINTIQTVAGEVTEKMLAAVDIAESAVIISTTATSTATGAMELSTNALLGSIRAEVAADQAVDIAIDAKAKAASVVQRADNGEFIGESGPQGVKGERGLQGEQGFRGRRGKRGLDGYMIPLATGFFRTEIRDGNLWIITHAVQNPFSIVDGNLILTI